jgi:hypothetical protein
MSPFSQIVRHNSAGSSILVVAGVAALVAIPWAVVHGPLELQWVLAQALGAAVIPTVAGWWTLWRRKGELKGALRVVLVASAVLFALEVWTQTRG